MELSEDGWSRLQGGYRSPYDPRNAIRQLRRKDSQAVWDELWQELHHQGDVGDASYAAVPEIVRVCRDWIEQDWNAFALIATIEEARGSPKNPPLPDWLKPAYEATWVDLEELALKAFPNATDDALICSILAVLALRKAQPGLSRMSLLTEAERQQMLDECGWG